MPSSEPAFLVENFFSSQSKKSGGKYSKPRESLNISGEKENFIFYFIIFLVGSIVASMPYVSFLEGVILTISVGVEWVCGWKK